MVSRLELIKAILPKTLSARIGTAALTAFAAYDVCCNQFGWPKIPAIWGMTGALLPLWAWLMLAQAAFLYGLFEYVRRLEPKADPSGTAIRLGDPNKMSNYDLGRKVEVSVANAWQLIRTNPSARNVEKAFYPIAALMVTLTKDKSIRWPDKTTSEMTNLQAALRIMERIAPLIKAGHDEEAQEAAAEMSDRLNQGARGASA